MVRTELLVPAMSARKISVALTTKEPPPVTLRLVTPVFVPFVHQAMVYIVGLDLLVAAFMAMDRDAGKNPPVSSSESSECSSQWTRSEGESGYDSDDEVDDGADQGRAFPVSFDFRGPDFPDTAALPRIVEELLRGAAPGPTHLEELAPAGDAPNDRAELPAGPVSFSHDQVDLPAEPGPAEIDDAGEVPPVDAQIDEPFAPAPVAEGPKKRGRKRVTAA